MTVALAFTIQGCGAAPAAQTDSAPQASAGTSCRLTVSITTTSGTTWGAVTAASGSATFSFGGARRTVGIPCGAKVQLRESPTDSNSAPFQLWRVGSRTVMGTRTSTVVTGPVEVQAVYRVVGLSSPTPTPSPSGN